MLTSTLLAVAALALPSQHSSDTKPDKALVPFPHPLITEVLFDPPSGADGDANKDGYRSATGDEFVELINPHDKPISLKGYTITDGKSLKKNAKNTEESRVRYTFGDITLEPGEVVVVFNGFREGAQAVENDEEGAKKEDPKPAADSGADKGQPKTKKRKPLSMNVKSKFVAFANGGDCVLLSDPEENAVHCITWIKKDKAPEDPAPLTERVPEGGEGSVVRVGLTRKLTRHEQLKGWDGALFSPGLHADRKPDDAAEPAADPKNSNPGAP